VEVFKHTYAESTKGTYRSHLKSYSAFCTVVGVPMIPASPQQVCLYCVLLARTLQYTSIKQYLNIISLLHRSMDLPSPLGSFMVISTLRGIKNTLGNSPSFKLPVTPMMLYSILDSLDLTKPASACLWMTCLLMFFALLRKSNVVGCHKILRSDVKFVNGAVNIWVKSTKTRNVNTDPPRVISLPRLPDHVLCPAAAILLYFASTPDLPEDAPLCSIPGRGGFSTLPYKSIVDMVKSVAPVDQTAQYSSHSFRRGGASYMHSIGMTMDQIKFMGDWKSDCFRRYVVFNSGVMSYRAISTMQKHLPPPPPPA